jgi:hypothetical protein
MPICLTYCPHNGNSAKCRGKTTLANHDHKQHWSIYDHGQLTIRCLLMPKHCNEEFYGFIDFDHHHFRQRFINVVSFD